MSIFTVMARAVFSVVAGYLLTVISYWLLLLINNYIMNQGPEDAWNILVPASTVLNTVGYIGKESWPTLVFTAWALILLFKTPKNKKTKRLVVFLIAASIISVGFANAKSPYPEDYGIPLTLACLGFAYMMVLGVWATKKLLPREKQK